MLTQNAQFTVDGRKFKKSILFQSNIIVEAGDILSIDNASTTQRERFSLQEKHHLLLKI